MPKTTPPQPQRFYCPRCSRSYTAKNSLTRHLRNHDPAKQSSCTTCGQTFRRADLLRRHERLHGECGLGTAVRQRNSACSNCQRSKVKCSGKSPCSYCLKQHKHCKFEHESSQDAILLGRDSTVSDSEALDLRMREVMHSAHSIQQQGHETVRPDAGQGLSWSWQWSFEEWCLPLHEPGLGMNHDLSSSLHFVDSNDYHPLPLNINIDATIFPVTSTATKEQRMVIAKLVEYARDYIAGDHRVFLEPSAFYFKISLSITTAFSIKMPDESSEPHLLDQFAALSTTHFALTQLMASHLPNTSNLHPFFYLSICALGSMQMGEPGQIFGSMLHERMRSTLLATPISAASQDQAPWLLQSLYLHTTIALYFGQHRAFTFAQDLLAKLVLAARRHRLFSLVREQAEADASQSQTQKALALEIYKIDVLVSVLLNERPLLSYEEILIPVGGGEGKMLMRNLVGMVLDKQAVWPLLSSDEVVMLGYALHEVSWNYSADRCCSDEACRSSSSSWCSSDSIDTAPASTLDAGGKSLRHALGRLQCPSALALAETKVQWRKLMDAQIAVRVAKMRLLAPLNLLHALPYCLFGSQPSSEGMVEMARVWAKSVHGREAVEVAVAAYTLFAEQASEKGREWWEVSGSTGLWAGMILHAVAVVVWVWTGCHPRRMIGLGGRRICLGMDRGDTGRRELVDICAESSARILAELMRLGERITMEGSLGRALVGEIKRMAENGFPGRR